MNDNTEAVFPGVYRFGGWYIEVLLCFFRRVPGFQIKAVRRMPDDAVVRGFLEFGDRLLFPLLPADCRELMKRESGRECIITYAFW